LGKLTRFTKTEIHNISRYSPPKKTMEALTGRSVTGRLFLKLGNARIFHHIFMLKIDVSVPLFINTSNSSAGRPRQL